MEQHELASGAVVAVIVSELIELAKRLKWVPLDCDTESLNRKVGVVAAFLTGLGLQFQFDAASGVLVVKGLLLSSVVQGIIQWASQQAYFRFAIKPHPVVVQVQRETPPVTLT